MDNFEIVKFVLFGVFSVICIGKAINHKKTCDRQELKMWIWIAFIWAVNATFF